ncbi:arsenate reductase/protein-tyrosine-phosphatase family protein [Parasporobacterium paucivorans]|uniref:Protein-tyrosine phosphatase n=1 Tax=Parasporobacterium paucivorans DSM 15970 TaxID=1122934 RepID=A0A1M6CPQ0_9FIRM|nr:hypothetical protein [Parasporobacterium paucivorans]SHI62863.1 protein-tyrosine phosphatase [Parasporobacterium paucivorans DSM 15970]
MVRFKRIIFVGTDNTSLTPLAAAILKNEPDMQDMKIESRGIIVLFPEPVNQKVLTIAEMKGLNLRGYQSKLLMPEDFSEETLVLVMDGLQKLKLYEEYKDAANVYTIREFVGEIGDMKTPYGGDLAEYSESYRVLERLVLKVKDKLKGEENK